MSLNISQYPKISGASALDLVPIWQTASGVQRAVQFQNLVPAVIGNLITSDSPQSANFSVAQTDKGKCFQVTTAASTITATLPLATSLADGFYFLIRKVDAGAGSVITSPVLSPISISLTSQGQGALIWSDGVNFFVFYFSTTASGGGGGGGTVTTTGSPASGNLTKFSGATSITNGDLTGDVTTSGTLTTTLTNIPDLTTQAGSILDTTIAAPTSPAAGKIKFYGDSTDLRFHDKNASGVIGTTVVSDTGAANNFLTAISAAGAISKSQPSFSNLSGSATAAQMPAFTGDVTTSAGSTVTTNVNLPDGVTQAGTLLVTNVAAPATPAAGKTRSYVDSTSKNIAVKNDAGTVNHGIQTRSATASNWIRSIADDGSTTISQPAFSDLSGSATAGQMPAFTGDVTTSAGSTVTTNVNLPNDVTMAGDLLITNTAAPASPASGKNRIFSDSTDLRFHDKNASGTIGTTVVSATAPGGQFVNSVSTAGVLSFGTPTAAVSPPITQNDEGTFTIPDTGRLLQPNRLTLSGSERSTIAGTGRIPISDVLNYEPSKGVTLSGSFNILDTEYQMQFKRLALFGNSRLTETGTGRDVLTDLGFSGVVNAFTSDGTTMTLISPKIVTGINDVNANQMLGITPTQGAVNNLTLSNSSTATVGGTIGAVGTGSNLDIALTPKGSGNVTIAQGSNLVFPSSGSGGDGLGINWGTTDQSIHRQNVGDRMLFRTGNSDVMELYGINSGNPRMAFHNALTLCWDSTNEPNNNTADIGFTRNTAGVVEVNNGTPGQYRDVIARNLSLSGTGPAPITQNDYPIGFTVPTNGLLQQPNRATLSGTERAILVGTGRDAISDQNPTNTPLQKVTLNPTSFIIRAGEYVMQYLRLALAGNTRATLTENARIVNFEFRPPSHLVLAGAGL